MQDAIGLNREFYLIFMQKKRLKKRKALTKIKAETKAQPIP